MNADSSVKNIYISQDLNVSSAVTSEVTVH